MSVMHADRRKIGDIGRGMLEAHAKLLKTIRLSTCNQQAGSIDGRWNRHLAKVTHLRQRTIEINDVDRRLWHIRIDVSVPSSLASVLLVQRMDAPMTKAWFASLCSTVFLQTRTGGIASTYLSFATTLVTNPKITASMNLLDDREVLGMY